LGEEKRTPGSLGASRGGGLGDGERSCLELPAAVLVVRTDAGSFDFACASLRETDAPLRMTAPN
jgi:hypothetical protein